MEGQAPRAATVVAVTGDVGAGKSTVSRLLSELSGGVLLDADAAAKDMWRRKEVIEAAVKRWGSGILDEDGNIIPGAVASRIFSDPDEHRWCCGLIHPLVMEDLRRRVAELAPDCPAVVEVPLLFEVGRPGWIDKVIFVTAPREARAMRCRAQRGWDEAELSRRESFFMLSEERMRLSDFVINNDGDLKELSVKVQEIIGEI